VALHTGTPVVAGAENRVTPTTVEKTTEPVEYTTTFNGPKVAECSKGAAGGGKGAVSDTVALG
jgi:hypothetical protein